MSYASYAYQFLIGANFAREGAPQTCCRSGWEIMSVPAIHESAVVSVGR